MGTNYYLMYNVCGECGKYDEKHIGKNSYGWQFLFRGYEGEIESLADWEDFIIESDGIIRDEYGEYVSEEELWSIILNNKKGKKNRGDRFTDIKEDPKSTYMFCYSEFS